MNSYNKEAAFSHSVKNPQIQNSSRLGNIFILFSFVVCFAFCELVLFGGFGIAVPLFFAVFYPFAIAMLSRGRRIFKEAVSHFSLSQLAAEK